MSRCALVPGVILQQGRRSVFECALSPRFMPIEIICYEFFCNESILLADLSFGALVFASIMTLLNWQASESHERFEFTEGIL